jgi:WD40 repeat protein
MSTPSRQCGKLLFMGELQMVALLCYCCRYDEGRCWYVGVGHSGEVTALAAAPDKSAVVSVGAEGGIFIWDYMRPPMSQAE